MYHVLAVKTVFRVHYAVSDADRGRSSDGLALIKGYTVVIWPVFGIQASSRHGRGENPVPEHCPAKHYGLKKLWKSQVIHIFTAGQEVCPRSFRMYLCKPAQNIRCTRLYAQIIVALIKSIVKMPLLICEVNIANDFVVSYKLLIDEFIA